MQHTITKRDDVKTGLTTGQVNTTFNCPKCGSDCLGFPLAIPGHLDLAVHCYSCKHNEPVCVVTIPSAGLDELVGYAKGGEDGK